MRAPRVRLPGQLPPAREQTGRLEGRPAALRQRAERLAGSLPPLLVAAERVATTVAQGVHGRRRVGQGETFWQFRRYQAGDPIAVIDWRQSAKSQHVFVRETEWEAAQSLWLWCDASPSMQYRSSRELPLKAEAAAVMALALASLLVRAGERVALLGHGMRPGGGRAAVQRVAAALTAPPHEPPSLPPVEPLPRFARVVLMGDFLSPLDDLQQAVAAYAARGLRGHLLQVVDPAEDSLPFRGRVRFDGLEGETPWLVSRVDTLRADYVEMIDRRRAALAALARAAGWTFAYHRTDRPPQTALLALYTALTENPGG